MDIEWDNLYKEKQDNWSKDRSNWLPDVVIDYTILRGSALDLGCGTGDKSALLYAMGFAVTGLDGSVAAIESAREKYPAISFRQFDLTELSSYTDQLFDLIIDIKTFPFIEDKAAYLNAIRSLLKQGGTFVLYTLIKHPTIPTLSVDALKDMLSGFSVLDITSYTISDQIESVKIIIQPHGS